MGDEPKDNVVHVVHPGGTARALERVAAKHGITVKQALKRAVKALVKYDKRKRKKRKSK